jgi:hypothetical protein
VRGLRDLFFSGGRDFPVDVLAPGARFVRLLRSGGGRCGLRRRLALRLATPTLREYWQSGPGDECDYEAAFQHLELLIMQVPRHRSRL